MAKTEAQVLTEMMEMTRGLTRWYFSKLKATDLHHQFEVNGIKLNNAFWTVAHLVVSQHFLMIVATGGEKMNIPWARQFGLGTTIPAPEDCPPLEEVERLLEEVHQQAIAHVGTLTDEQLDEPTTTGTAFGGVDSKRNIISHCIRHEGTHIGHLGWLCKLHKIDTV